ncbi:MarR family winged helix-turn-helix transcriptional regulator [Nocardia sp. alder85J]|uniref:MarR family winged helix-turn-helix transcriptional regulator n=1 Tax=Nocardia sp. alder85J TaxID=2862949 RepID=UPI001CD2BB6F|nr:MarR family winged helix-turn-helix transcriptional regulator [Nocardia sp. alder85J]MCX4091825.1 MarR family winged helix-turn-helix transcriptional regulator [Nocardia sp. alder85J]
MTHGGASAGPDGRDDRDRMQIEIARDIRALTAVSEQIGHRFARSNELRATDFRALMHIATADTEGTPLTAGGLRAKMGLSPAAVTYLVERLIESGHVRRSTDPADRRRVLLHHSEHGMAVASEFFTPLGARTREGTAELPDADLAAAHRVLTAIVAAMRRYHAEPTPAGGAAEPDTEPV